jgi:NADH:ubiquinone oxidoreductase subunit E
MIATDEQKMQDLKNFIAETADKNNSESQLIAVLHKAQEMFGYLSQDVMSDIAEQMQIPTAHIWGVATFYHYFKLKKQGRYVISICLGTACYVKGANQLLETLKQELKIDMGGTTEDNLFSLQPARCLGACGLAPVVMINDKIHGELTSKKMLDLLKLYRKEAAKQ